MVEGAAYNYPATSKDIPEEKKIVVISESLFS
jgi:hypothetical protein